MDLKQNIIHDKMKKKQQKMQKSTDQTSKCTRALIWHAVRSMQKQTLKKEGKMKRKKKRKNERERNNKSWNISISSDTINTALILKLNRMPW